MAGVGHVGGGSIDCGIRHGEHGSGREQHPAATPGRAGEGKLPATKDNVVAVGGGSYLRQTQVNGDGLGDVQETGVGGQGERKPVQRLKPQTASLIAT